MENKLFLLRKPKKRDIEDLLQVKNNKETAKYLGGNTPTYTYADIEKWIDFHNNCENEELFIIQDKNNSKVIGHIGLYNIDLNVKSAEYAILIGNNNYLGQGVGGQATDLILNFAFEKLLLNRVYLYFISDNIRALNLYLKMGFKKEGCLRQAVFKNNTFYDSIVMSMLKKEYDS